MSADDSDRIQTFEAFWPYYVGEHRLPLNRAFHYVGTSSLLTLPILAALLGNPWLLLLIPVAGYGPAWIGHFILEKNRPATFTYPVWSLLGDLKMVSYALTGRMGGEVTRLYGSRHPAPDAPLLVAGDAA